MTNTITKGFETLTAIAAAAYLTLAPGCAHKSASLDLDSDGKKDVSVEGNDHSLRIDSNYSREGSMIYKLIFTDDDCGVRILETSSGYHLELFCSGSTAHYSYPIIEVDDDGDGKPDYMKLVLDVVEERK